MKTALFDFHREHNAKMVDFAGYDLPLTYKAGGLLAEHHHTREKCAIFDVSHMGQVILNAQMASVFGGLVAADISTIPLGASKYTFILNEAGGIIDDCIISNDGDRGYHLVVNGARKIIDIEYINAAGGAVALLPDQGLFALQGPKAAAVMAYVLPAAAELKFMQGGWFLIDGVECRVCRCGYTGEDGFEISVPDAHIRQIVDKFMANADVAPAGLGARDSLRLEAGLSLYGNDLDETTSPIEAGLLWAIPKHRREGNGYKGAGIIKQHIDNGAPRKMVGLLPKSKVPVRAGAPLLADGVQIGAVTSGCFSPTLGVPIAMGYIANEGGANTTLTATVRQQNIECEITSLPFVSHNYKR